jgi:hypothetical protein
LEPAETAQPAVVQMPLRAGFAYGRLRRICLKKAVEWDGIDRMPRTVKLLRVDKGNAAFYDADELLGPRPFVRADVARSEDR